MPTPTNKLISNLVGGEVSQYMDSRLELPVYAKSLTVCKNFIILPQGGGRFRHGSSYVKNTRLNKLAWYIPFQFSDQQSYLLELTDGYMRFFTQDGAVLLSPVTISGVSNASPGVITSAGHGFSNGDEVFVDKILGTSGLNAQFYLAANVAANTFTLTDINGTAIDTTNRDPYVSGGTAAKVYEVQNTVLTEARIPLLTFAQSADTIYFSHRDLHPRKIVRSGNTTWTFSSPAFTDPNGFFGADASGNCPGAVAFIDSGRLVFGGSTNQPETVWGSQAPSVGGNNFQNFTTGVNDTDAFTFLLTGVQGKVDSIQNITNTTKYMIITMFGSTRLLYGASTIAPISPTSVTDKAINTFGCAKIAPIANGDTLFYVQRDGKAMRGLKYDYYQETYQSPNKNLIADHITKLSPFAQIVEQHGVTETIIWAPLANGVLTGFTYDIAENIDGWHQHTIAGQYRDAVTKVLTPRAKVLNCGIMPRTTGGDMLWLIVEREINGVTNRTIEYITDEPGFPRREDFVSDDEAGDTTLWADVMWEANKQSNHLDMSISYDGSSAGLAANISLTPATATGISVNISSAIITGTVQAPIVTPTDFFTVDMVGREIWKEYDPNGTGGGRAVISAFIDTQNVTAQVIQDFDSVTPMSPGGWFLTTNELSGLGYLEGQTIGIVVDGALYPDQVVNSGNVNLDIQVSTAHAGLRYRGEIRSMNQDGGGATGTAEAKPRSITRCMVKMLNTIGLQFGTSPYVTEFIENRSTIVDRLDRGPIPYTGTSRVDISDNYDQFDKKCSFVQKVPMPATLLGFDIFMRTVDEGN